MDDNLVELPLRPESDPAGPDDRELGVLGHQPTGGGAASPPTTLEVVTTPSGSLVPVGLLEDVRAFAAEAKAGSTRTTYRSAWATFTEWCSTHGLEPLPASPGTVALFLSAQASAGRKVATMQKALAAISEAHRASGHPSPRQSEAVRAVLKGIRRKLGVAQRQVAPVLPADLRAMLQHAPAGLLGIRDRALLTLGFAGAFRRSELVGLNVEDLAFTADGLEVRLVRSKTDQEGTGRKVGVPYGSYLQTCPVRSVKAWLGASGMTDGPLFRAVNRHGRVATTRLQDRAVARLVKRYAAAAGLDADSFSGHSLRSGLVTAAAKAGKSEHSIMKTTGHRSSAMVRRYIRDAKLFDDNAAAGIGL